MARDSPRCCSHGVGWLTVLSSLGLVAAFWTETRERAAVSFERRARNSICARSTATVEFADATVLTLFDLEWELSSDPLDVIRNCTRTCSSERNVRTLRAG